MTRLVNPALAISVLILLGIVNGAAFGTTLSRSIEANADEGWAEYGTYPYQLVNTGQIYIGNYDNIPFPALYINDANLRFNNIIIPQGSAITSATMTLDATGSRAADVPAQISAFSADNCPALTNSNFSGTWIANQQLTSVRVNWTIPTGNGIRTSPDIAGIISEVVNRPGWVSGNSICIFVAYTGPGIQDPDNHHEELTTSCGFVDLNSPCGDNTSHPSILTINYSQDSALPVAIDIKPGSFPNSINPKSKGKIPVAILSSATFNAPASVDMSSLTFGRSGNEASLAFCNTSGEDVNGDFLADLVCHFNTQTAAFQAGDTQGVLKGKTTTGTPLAGNDSVRTVPQ